MKQNKYLVTLFFETYVKPRKVKKMEKKFKANTGHEAIEEALKSIEYDRNTWNCYGQSAKKV